VGHGESHNHSLHSLRERAIMKNFTKPVLAAATIAALASGFALTQGGVANAATPSDCAVAVSIPATPVALTTAATTSLAVTTTWTGACLTELPTAAATYSFVSVPTADSTTTTALPAAGTVTSSPLSAKTGTATVSIPTSALPAAGTFIKLVEVSPEPAATATQTPPSADTVVTGSATAPVKNDTSANIKYSRTGKSITFVGHSYAYTPPVAPATVGKNVGQDAAVVRLQKLVGTEYQTVGTTTTSSTGRYEFNLTDTTAGSYRVATNDTATLNGYVTPTVVATIDPHSATKVIRLKATKVAKKVTVSGTLYTLKPVESKYKATVGVAAYLEKKVNGSWTIIKKVRSTTAGSISGVANNVHKTAYRFVVIQNSKYNTSTSATISK
jgi:5-hydroxyisourate hydrolase-like protein (transthyretin family)